MATYGRLDDARMPLSASAKLSPAEMDERSALANFATALLASSPSVCSAPSSVSPAPTRRASWRRNSVTSRGRGSLAGRLDARQMPLRRDLRLDRQVAQILDAPDDLLAGRRIDFPDDDLS